MKPQTPMTVMCSIRGVFFTGLLAVCLASFDEGSTNTQTQWSGNGHYYAVVNQVTSWQQAKVLAEGMEFMGVHGHLATITSEAENTFVTTELGGTAVAWLGGYQLPGSSEPEGGWQWITGEPWTYTNWDSGEPNNTYGGDFGTSDDTTEEVLHYGFDGTHWNDLPSYLESSPRVSSSNGMLVRRCSTPHRQLSATAQRVVLSYSIRACNQSDRLRLRTRNRALTRTSVR